MARSTRASLIAALVMIGGCSACATVLTTATGGTFVTGTAERQLRDMITATTGQPDGHEIGGCLRGYTTPDGAVVVTEVVYPTRMRNTSRTGIAQLACFGLDGIVGRVHFHPWFATNDGQCLRSPEADAPTHAASSYPIDIVVCPGGTYRWYRRDGRNQQVSP